MSNTKTVMSQAANTQGIPLDITDVFSTYLYTGNGSSQTITNDIDLAGEGGLVWAKARSISYGHMLFDTERGAGNYIRTDSTAAQATSLATLSSFNSDGFTLGNNNPNISPQTFASWTFRKAPKFFDVVTYTGTGAFQNISHNLGSVAGMIVVKKTNGTGDWLVYHRHAHIGQTYQPVPERKYLNLNDTGSVSHSESMWGDTAPTDTAFSVGADTQSNSNGDTYVAYLFAHNDGDGEFGPNGDADIIKCGSYTGTGVANDLLETLGFEPQWMLVKRTDAASDWIIVDNMRGAVAGGDVYNIYANDSAAEVKVGSVAPDAVGIRSGNVGAWGESNASGGAYIYIAIRRGPLAPPESGTEVFEVTNGTTPLPTFRSNFAVDLAIQKSVGGNDSSFGTRLLGATRLKGNSTDAEVAQTNNTFDYNNGYFEYYDSGFASSTYAWMWRRAPGFFDVVAYTGAGAGTTFNHNLGVAPEMIWVKNRSRSNTNWNAYHKDLKLNGVPDTAMDCTLFPNINSGISGIVDFWGSSGPSDTQVILGTNSLQNSWSGDTFISYLFATLAGVSKVFSVTKSSGSDASVDCGFTSGPRLVMLKRTDSTGDWYVWDTERGIVAGNDPYLLLNSTAAEVTSTDYIDPTSNGFTIVNGGLADGDYIGYAVA